MVAGKLPLDPTSLKYLTNPLALQINQQKQPGSTGGGDGTQAAAHSIHYTGNCTLAHGSIPRDFFPAQPCVQLWARGGPDATTVGGSSSASSFASVMVLALINMGENATTVVPTDSPALAAAMTPAPPAAAAAGGGGQRGSRGRGSWLGVDVWSGEAVQASEEIALRPHASRLLRFTKTADADE